MFRGVTHTGRRLANAAAAANFPDNQAHRLANNVVKRPLQNTNGQDAADDSDGSDGFDVDGRMDVDVNEHDRSMEMYNDNEEDDDDDGDQRAAKIARCDNGHE